MGKTPENNQIIQELSDLINRSIDIADFPYKKGNSIRIGGYAIRKKKSAYIIIKICLLLFFIYLQSIKKFIAKYALSSLNIFNKRI